MLRSCSRLALLALLGLLLSLGLAACGAIPPTSTPVPPTATPTTPPAASPSPTVVTTTSPPAARGAASPSGATLAAGASVRVGSATGPGLPGVAICLSLAGYSGSQVGTTDATGAYQARYPRILHQELVTIWAELAGYRFDPPFAGGNAYSGSTGQPITIAFIAHPVAASRPAARAASPCNRTARDFSAPATTTAGAVAPLRLTAMAVTRFLERDKRPSPDTTTFPPASALFITHTVEEAQPGQSVALRVYRDGVPLQLQDTRTAFDRQSFRFHGYCEYRPLEPGRYKAELSVNDDTAPTREVTFTVAER